MNRFIELIFNSIKRLFTSPFPTINFVFFLLISNFFYPVKGLLVREITNLSLQHRVSNAFSAAIDTY